MQIPVRYLWFWQFSIFATEIFLLPLLSGSSICFVLVVPFRLSNKNVKIHDKKNESKKFSEGFVEILRLGKKENLKNI